MQGSSRWFLAGLGRRLFPISQSVVIEDRSTHDPGRDPGLIGAHHPRLSMWAAGCGNYPGFHSRCLSIWAHTRKCEMVRMGEGLKALVTLEESSRLSLTLSGWRWGRYQVRTCLPDLQALEPVAGTLLLPGVLANGKNLCQPQVPQLSIIKFIHLSSPNRASTMHLDRYSDTIRCTEYAV